MNLLAPILIVAILAIVAVVAIVAGLVVWLGRGITSALGSANLVTALCVVAAFGVGVFLVLSISDSKSVPRTSESIPLPVLPQSTVVVPTSHDASGDSAGGESGSTVSAPMHRFAQPTDRSEPSWIDEPPQTVSGKFRTHIVAGPYDRTLDCETELDQKLLTEARQYVAREFGAGLVEPSLEYLRANVVVDEHVESTQHEFGGVMQNMYQVYRLLEFDEADRNYFAALSRDKKVERRLAYAGFGLASVLVLLSTAFGYLRIDQVTAGRYRRRLQLATTAVILSLLGGAVVFVRLVPLV